MRLLLQLTSSFSTFLCQNCSCQIHKFVDAGMMTRSPGLQNCIQNVWRLTRTGLMNFNKIRFWCSQFVVYFSYFLYWEPPGHSKWGWFNSFFSVSCKNDICQTFTWPDKKFKKISKHLFSSFWNFQSCHFLYSSLKRNLS